MEGIVINSGSSFELTIAGGTDALLCELKALLDGTDSGTVEDFIAKTGITCKEIEDYADKYRATWTAECKLQEEDEDYEFRLPVEPYCNLDALFGGRPLPLDLSRSVARNFGVENLAFYIRNRKALNEPHFVWHTHRDRGRFDALVRFGLASMGATSIKKCKEGEEFRLISLPFGLSMGQVGLWLAYLETRAFLLSHTYRMARPLSVDPAVQEILKGWEIMGAGDDAMCPLCRKMDGKRVGFRDKLPPFHVGCRCARVEIFD